ncbi:MAG: dihydropteroate synthase [Bacteroidota bacterium]|nr:dihydropteroate synthase [Bacteroidota bacterium]
MANSRHLIISCRGQRIDCGAGPVVMGILNVTPDSFYDGGRYMKVADAVRRARAMAMAGAQIIDIGGASSRPAGRIYGKGAELLTEEEEARRVLPVVRAVADAVPQVVLSIDTYRLPVAEAALDAGAHMLNDITGLRAAPGLAALAGAAEAPLVVMHAIGLPGSMPHEHAYARVEETVYRFLDGAVEQARATGVRDVIVDPGFGFGKSFHDNLRLLNRLNHLAPLNCPIMVGISRKSTIGAAIATGDEPAPVQDRLGGTLGATAVAVLRGAHIVRTHDVKPTVDMLRVLDLIVRQDHPEHA